MGNQNPLWIKSDSTMCRTAWVLKWQKRLTGFPWKLPIRQAQVLSAEGLGSGGEAHQTLTALLASWQLPGTIAPSLF